MRLITHESKRKRCFYSTNRAVSPQLIRLSVSGLRRVWHITRRSRRGHQQGERIILTMSVKPREQQWNQQMFQNFSFYTDLFELFNEMPRQSLELFLPASPPSIPGFVLVFSAVGPHVLQQHFSVIFNIIVSTRNLSSANIGQLHLALACTCLTLACTVDLRIFRDKKTHTAHKRCSIPTQSCDFPHC